MTSAGISLSAAIAAEELLKRKKAKSCYGAFIAYVKPEFIFSDFSRLICDQVDQFVDEMLAGIRPILVFKAPPQHGKSELISRLLPPYLFMRLIDIRIAQACYALDLAREMGRHVKAIMASRRYKNLIADKKILFKKPISRANEFTLAFGHGSYLCVGVGGGLTGRPVDLLIIDDPVKNHEQALSETVTKSVAAWYETTSTTRMSENSGKIIMATSWTDLDLPSIVSEKNEGKPNFKLLSFPALNYQNEINYNPDLKEGALVPELHSERQLREIKSELSEIWWAALYQQSTRGQGGNIFKEIGWREYGKNDLPARFERVIASIDCAFDDKNTSDYVVISVWGCFGRKKYMIHQVREQMSFTDTKTIAASLPRMFPDIVATLIENKANGPAVISELKTSKARDIVAVEPHGSKVARAHSITGEWESGNIILPSSEVVGEKTYKIIKNEILGFPRAKNDDIVDSMTQAVWYLMTQSSGYSNLSKLMNSHKAFKYEFHN